MNSLPLSVSIPSSGNGNIPRAGWSACTTPCCVRCSNGKHSVQVVATSVKVSVYRKAPSALPPQCATRSASKNPGWPSVHSVNVRTGICFLSSMPGFVVLKPCGWRRGASSRSAVAALSISRASRVWSVRLKWPCRASVGINSGRKGTSRLPQTPFAALQAVASACWTSTPYCGAR